MPEAEYEHDRPVDSDYVPHERTTEVLQKMACGAERPSLAEDPISHYVISRRDLKIGLIAANIIHAAGESGPVPEHAHAVALTVEGEPQLRVLSQVLSNASIDHTPIIECDGEHAGQMMAIGVRPALKSTLKRFFRGMDLLGKEKKK